MKLGELAKLTGRYTKYDITLYDSKKYEFTYLTKYFTSDEILRDERLSNMTIRNIDLRRKTTYRQRGKNKKNVSKGFKDQTYRIGRTYKDNCRYDDVN